MIIILLNLGLLTFVIPENFGAERRNLSGIHYYDLLYHLSLIAF